jgi:purine catabolism regulator
MSSHLAQVPLSWLLERPGLGLAAHHVPEHPPALAWAHAIELDDPGPWLPEPATAGQGLLLTTGLRLPRTRAGQDAYVARLVAAGVGALGVGTGLRLAAVPFGVVSACRARELALVEVPLETPFLAVVRALSERLSDLRRARLSASVRAQQRLTRAAVRRGVGGLCAELASSVDAAVVLTTPDGVALADAGRPGLSIDDVQAALRRARVTPGPVVTSDGRRTVEVQPLGPSPTVVTGWLALARSAPLDAAERLVVSHALGILTLDAERPGTGLDPRSALTLRHVVSGAPVDPASLLAAAGLDPAAALVLVVARGPSTAVRRLVAGLSRHEVVLAAPPSPPSSSWRLLTTPSGAALLTRYISPSVAAVASPAVAAASLPAVEPLAWQRLAVTADGSVVALSADPVLQATGEGGVGAAARPWLAALEEHDAAHDTELLSSLTAYLRHHGTWDPAAQALGIHRHTLRQRVTKAARIAGFDLDDAGHRALLTLALPGTRSGC